MIREHTWMCQIDEGLQREMGLHSSLTKWIAVWWEIDLPTNLSMEKQVVRNHDGKLDKSKNAWCYNAVFILTLLSQIIAHVLLFFWGIFQKILLNKK